MYALVEERSEDPEAIADRYDLDVADIYHALAYYHDHPREMRTVEQERDDAMEDFRGSIVRPEGVDPDTA
ncbi:Putative antitoxin of wHTH fold [Halorhabdus sp. SVX81]|nr:Putative antitoxin of wHTH fold [Halorhabdus sp. SVX81]